MDIHIKYHTIKLQEEVQHRAVVRPALPAPVVEEVKAQQAPPQFNYNDYELIVELPPYDFTEPIDKKKQSWF